MFYIVIASARLDLNTLRREGWLFEMGNTREPWYKFYTLYGNPTYVCLDITEAHWLLDFRATQWGVLWSTLPTQFALYVLNICVRNSNWVFVQTLFQYPAPASERSRTMYVQPSLSPYHLCPRSLLIISRSCFSQPRCEHRQRASGSRLLESTGRYSWYSVRCLPLAHEPHQC